MHARSHAHTLACTHAATYAATRACMHTSTHARTHARAHVRMYAHAPARTHAHMLTQNEKGLAHLADGISDEKLDEIEKASKKLSRRNTPTTF